MRLRFGLDDGRARTLEEVGKEFNVTRERIRQIEAKALSKASSSKPQPQAEGLSGLMAGKVQLSERLTAIAEMVTEGNRLVDVGCDHGYLPVYLMLQHKIPRAIATDVGKLPSGKSAGTHRTVSYGSIHRNEIV